MQIGDTKYLTCHLSLTITATATDPPPANSPTMHSRLVCKENNFLTWGTSLFIPNLKQVSNPNSCENLPKKDEYKFTLWPEFSTPWFPADCTDNTKHRPTLQLTDWFDLGVNSVSYILTNCVCQIAMPCICMLQLVFCEIIMFDIFYKLDFNIFQLNIDFYASIQIWIVRCCTFRADENIFIFKNLFLLDWHVKSDKGSFKRHSLRSCSLQIFMQRLPGKVFFHKKKISIFLGI